MDEGKTVRWFIVAVAAVVIALTASCTVAYVVNPTLWTCEMSSKDVTC